MQNAELYRRGIVVPLDHEAETGLRNNSIQPGLQIEYFEIQEVVFEGLWQKGLFRRLNDGLGTIIDDYEEELVEKELLPTLTEIVKKFWRESQLSVEEEGVIRAIARLSATAIEQEVPIFFIL